MALSANKFDNYRSSERNMRRAFIVANGSTIYRGAMVSVNADGYLIPAADTASTHFAGVALDKVVGDGVLTCEVDIGGCEVKASHEDGSLTIANVGDAVVCDTDEQVTSVGTGTNDIPVGVIAEVVDATTVWVKCRGFGVLS